MGLDMYLISVPRLDGMDFEEVLQTNGRLREIKEAGGELFERIKPHIKHHEEFGHSWENLLEEVAYWRKANQIHHWFVETLRDGDDEPCFIHEVTKKQIIELHALCLQVLTKHTHPAYILPTRAGSFFGSTSYDDFYYHEIERTKTILDNLIENFNFETHYLYYECSW